MKSAGKRTASPALAQMLAVTAMLVDRGINFLFALHIFGQSPSALSLLPLQLGRCFVGGHKMKQVDCVRMAEKCAREADRMPPSAERDELLKKVKLFESYPKMDNWI